MTCQSSPWAWDPERLPACASAWRRFRGSPSRETFQLSGVSALDAIASAAAIDDAKDVAVWLDGARKEVFAAQYRRDPSVLFGVEALGDPIAAPPDAVFDRVGRARLASADSLGWRGRDGLS